MKRLLKYLIPVIAAAVFWNCADDASSFVPEEPVAGMSVDGAVSDTGISSSEQEFFLPRSSGFTNAHRVQTGARRTNSVQRSNFEFTKSGKVINAGLRYFVQKNSLIHHSTLIEPSHRLLRLGKLII